MGEEKQKKKGVSGALKKFYGVGDCGFKHRCQTLKAIISAFS